MHSAFPRLAAAVLVGLTVALAGCEEESRITAENFQKLKAGMTIPEVEELLGSGKEDSSPPGLSISGAGIGTTTDAPQEQRYVYDDGGAKIIVTFMKGKVVNFERSGF